MIRIMWWFVYICLHCVFIYLSIYVMCICIQSCIICAFVYSAAIGNVIHYRLDVLRGLGLKYLPTVMVIITVLNFIRYCFISFTFFFFYMLVICIKYNVTVKPNSNPQKYLFFICMARIVNWCFIYLTKLWISSDCICYSEKLKSSPLLEISIFLNSHSKNYYWYIARAPTNPTTPAPDAPIYLSDPSFLPEKN